MMFLCRIPAYQLLAELFCCCFGVQCLEKCWHVNMMCFVVIKSPFFYFYFLTFKVYGPCF